MLTILSRRLSWWWHWSLHDIHNTLHNEYTYLHTSLASSSCAQRVCITIGDQKTLAFIETKLIKSRPKQTRHRLCRKTSVTAYKKHSLLSPTAHSSIWSSHLYTFAHLYITDWAGTGKGSSCWVEYLYLPVRFAKLRLSRGYGVRAILTLYFDKVTKSQSKQSMLVKVLHGVHVVFGLILW